MPVSEDDLVGAGRLVDRFETDRDIERRAMWCRRSQADSLETMTGVFDERLYEGATYPGVTHVGRHIDMPNTGDIRIVEVWIPVQPANTDETQSHPCLEDGLTGAVEPIGAVVPLFDETPNEVVALSLARLEQAPDVGRKRGNGLDHEVCDHEKDRMADMKRVVVVGSSGSGKTTVARALSERLGVSHLEMDSVFHQHGWADDAPEDFLQALDRFTTTTGSDQTTCRISPPRGKPAQRQARDRVSGAGSPSKGESCTASATRQN